MDFTAPDRTLYPEFEPYLRFSMPLETRAFSVNFSRAITQFPTLLIATSHYSTTEWLNTTGFLVSRARTFAKSIYPDSLRGGFLSQASIHKVSANGTNTSPIVRGIYVLERILGITPSPPPPGTPGVEPDIRGASTLRELLDKHRDLESCASCHNKLTLWDLLWRVLMSLVFSVNGFGTEIPMQKEFKMSSGGVRCNIDLVPMLTVLDNLLMEQSIRTSLVQSSSFKSAERSCTGFCKKLLTFATGRELGFSDRDEIERIVTQSAKNEYRLRELLHLVIGSKIFLNK